MGVVLAGHCEKPLVRRGRLGMVHTGEIVPRWQSRLGMCHFAKDATQQLATIIVIANVVKGPLSAPAISKPTPTSQVTVYANSDLLVMWNC